MKWIVITMVNLICSSLVAQNIDARLSAAIKNLEADTQFKHAILSLYVVDSKTGKVIFDRNAQIGLAPASCQKVITSASAFELLGKEYRYKTSFLYGKELHLANFNHILIVGSGDPTLGSWRYKNTIDTLIFFKVYNQLIKKQVPKIFNGTLVFNFQRQNNPVPDGYVWQDIGNYYGAGTYLLNWRENQFDLQLRSFSDTKPLVINDVPKQTDISLYNFLSNGPKGSGDNAYIYSSPLSKEMYIRGTIPPNQNKFVISGSMTDPGKTIGEALNSFLIERKFSIKDIVESRKELPENKIAYVTQPLFEYDTIYNHYSPPLDSINYWFLKKSINLYGEALVKTISMQNKGAFSTDTGVAIIKNFWKDKGIEPSAINILDGSGLSPANRVTTNALVTVMQYAKKQPWFSSFYYALPEANGIKMKDGYITGVRSYTGYIKSKSGNEYTFSFIANNFDGSAGTVREKMWKVLDILK